MPWLRNRASWVLTVGYVLVTAAWAFAPQPGRHGRDALSVLAYLLDLGPILSVGFGVSAAALVVAVLLRRGERYAHTLAAAVTAGYGAAILFTGLLDATRYTSPGAVAALTLAAVHILLARAYQTTVVVRPDREERR